jgi:hypothetical protein
MNVARKKGQPRAAATYRAARRNAARGHVWEGEPPSKLIVYKPAWDTRRDRKRWAHRQSAIRRDRLKLMRSRQSVGGP